ncbi:MAG: UDP-N-acetylglucosamine--N-acetylmuramyl-(pentapeptide) pyrophosphoryl-undecaprenol N-acetylglucosamine transferase [Verrucomicrobiota bacterium]|nr:UDP-N-acetylglucosamine--N-acetylmuramyl-(pentapeptide) pyrophosphoryl-undecaprenol N-acetylglucosamine transferase [Verrucomicrobiota bacterium]
MRKFIIACGGTGGHLSPGIAVAEMLKERGNKCLLLISQKQVDSALIKKYEDLDFVKISGRAFTGGMVERFRFFFDLLSSFMVSWRLLRQQAPDLVLLFGGFLSLGLGLAAKARGIPIALHEANSHPGRAVRFIKHISRRIYLPHAVSLNGVSHERIRHYGYPLRKEITRSDKEHAQSRLKIKVPNKLLVVMGGSQGAYVLNDWVEDNFRRLAKEGISIYCVTGLGSRSAETLHEVDEKGNKITATLVPFSDQMSDVICAADLIVSRAGAGSIAEIAHCRTPAILIPYPYASDNHQEANALAHEEAGAGITLAQEQLVNLTDKVIELIYNNKQLDNFKNGLERLEHCNASELITSDLLNLCERRMSDI